MVRFLDGAKFGDTGVVFPRASETQLEKLATGTFVGVEWCCPGSLRWRRWRRASALRTSGSFRRRTAASWTQET